mgnify:CR=1 FL=1|tara:strand:- start:762 stop:1487 length:726 start_codon:yes stop_codon:yes gene_type:complete
MILTILLIILIFYAISHSSRVTETFTLSRSAIIDSALNNIKKGFEKTETVPVKSTGNNDNSNKTDLGDIVEKVSKDTSIENMIHEPTINFNKAQPSYTPYEGQSNYYELPNSSDTNINKYNSKELYSILLNGLNTKSENFIKLVENTVETACELLKLKKDLSRIRDCLVDINETNIGVIHRILIKAHAYTISPKYNTNKIMDPYLVNKLNKNIKDIMDTGNDIILNNSNVCTLNGIDHRPC